MRWVAGSIAFLCLSLVALLTLHSVAACLYFPQCDEYNYDDCGSCKRALYNTACDGGCDYTGHETCESYAECTLDDTRTIQGNCNAGYVIDQVCSDSSCDWANVGSCYLDPAGDADGDGVTNSVDDCPNTYANPSSNPCNGCPNPTCSGCMSVDFSFCPQSGRRVCLADDSQCTSYQCADPHCSFGQMCSYDQPYCDENLASCTCTKTCAPDSSCVDSDGDGVDDASDQCPNTPSGELVDMNTGCSCSQITCDDQNDCTENNCEVGVCQYPPDRIGVVCNFDDGDLDPSDGECDGAGSCIEAGIPCSAIPGCLADPPLGVVTVPGECPKGEMCYTCPQGTSWNGTACSSSAGCEQDGDACGQGGTCCGGACVDTATDETNCGACRGLGGAVCSGALPQCSGGTCTCTADSCGPGNTCVAGGCEPTLSPSLSLVVDASSVVVGEPFGFTAAARNFPSAFLLQLVGTTHVWDCPAVSCSERAVWSEDEENTFTYHLSASGYVSNAVTVSVFCPDGTSWHGNECLPDCVATTETCNGVDDDCDGVADPEDLDACADPTPYCIDRDGWACVECRGPGDCGPGFTCTDHVCTATPYVLNADPGNILQQEGQSFSTLISISPERDFLLEVEGFALEPVATATGYLLEGVSYSPGEWALALTAHDLAG